MKRQHLAFWLPWLLGCAVAVVAWEGLPSARPMVQPALNVWLWFGVMLYLRAVLRWRYVACLLWGTGVVASSFGLWVLVQGLQRHTGVFVVHGWPLLLLLCSLLLWLIGRLPLKGRFGRPEPGPGVPAD